MPHRAPLPILRIALLTLLALIPLSTLFHRNDAGTWDFQRSVMAAPDEPSYLLMAQHFLDGGGLSLRNAVGRDTFYPPGYPLLLAGWTRAFFGGTITPFAAHALNALLLSINVILVYFVTRAFLRAQTILAETPPLLIAALFATNWHVLDTALLIMSEPAFMAVLFCWLLIPLLKPRWYKSPLLAATMALLATVAWSIRGAGVVCVAATLLFPFLHWKHLRPLALTRHAAIAVALPALYQILLMIASPAKSLAAPDDGHGYVQQLLPAFSAQLPALILRHILDFCETFLPVARWREGIESFARFPAAIAIGTTCLASLCIYTFRNVRNLSFPHFFLLLYLALYLLWPFSFQRFWVPVLPLMLACAWGYLYPRVAAAWPARRHALTMMMSLMLVLSVEECLLWQGTYARRLNHVSDALAESARAIVRTADNPDGAVVAVMSGDEHFIMAWHLSQAARTPTSRYPLAGGFQIVTPLPADPARGRRPERIDDFLLRTLDGEGKSRIYFFSYFPESSPDTADTLQSLRQRRPELLILIKLYEKRPISQVWALSKS